MHYAVPLCIVILYVILSYSLNVRKHYVYQGIGGRVMLVLYSLNVRKYYIYQGIGGQY